MKFNKKFKKQVFQSPSLGRMSLDQVIQAILDLIRENPSDRFRLIIGTDSESQGFEHGLEKGRADVLAYVKNNRYVHFQVEYISQKGGMRYYYPDFIVRTKSGMFAVETKGLEDLEVAKKDQRIKQWCQYATKLTDQKWQYLKVLEQDFNQYRFSDFKNITNFSVNLCL